jgi:DNA-binding response OmpR family regulator
VPLKVLLVESESTDFHSMESDLLGRGCEVAIAHTSLKAASIATADWPDLIVVNVCTGLLNVDEVFQALDETRLEFPRLIVFDDEAHRHLPADAYLPVPFTPRQLTHRINKALGTQSDRFLRVGDVTLDGSKRQVQRTGHRAHLTPKEFKLLRLLMQHAGEVLNRRTIMNEVWDTDYLGDTRTLDVHIRWLREKLEDNPSRPQYIVTVRGVGYRFSPKET